MHDEEVRYFMEALKEIVIKSHEWKKDYIYNPKKNEFEHRSLTRQFTRLVAEWFKSINTVYEAN